MQTNDAPDSAGEATQPQKRWAKVSKPHRYERGHKKMPGTGRKKGQKNGFSMDLRKIILESLHLLNGPEYLVQQGRDNPVAYLNLLAKLMPVSVIGDCTNPIQVQHTHTMRLDFEAIRTQRAKNSQLPAIQAEAAQEVVLDAVKSVVLAAALADDELRGDV